MQKAVPNLESCVSHPEMPKSTVIRVVMQTQKIRECHFTLLKISDQLKLIFLRVIKEFSHHPVDDVCVMKAFYIHLSLL